MIGIYLKYSSINLCKRPNFLIIHMKKVQLWVHIFLRPFSRIWLQEVTPRSNEWDIKLPWCILVKLMVLHIIQFQSIFIVRISEVPKSINAIRVKMNNSKMQTLRLSMKPNKYILQQWIRQRLYFQVWFEDNLTRGSLRKMLVYLHVQPFLSFWYISSEI